MSAEDLYNRALRVMPGGVSSPVRAFGAVGGTPRFAARGEGAYIFDTDGNRYIDLVCSWGALPLGHAAPSVVSAVSRAASLGTSFGAPTEAEVLLAEEVIARVPSIEKLRFVSSGTEAAMSAIRLARAFTKRDLIVKFAGCYHGHADGLLASAGSGAATFALPDSPGVPASFAAQTIVVPYNDSDAVGSVVEDFGDRIAAIIVEPIAANMGVVPPVEGFLKHVRSLCDSSGALLIFDEVITGFRVARGGAQELLSINPDITMLGKVLGGGLPIGAYGSRAEIMDLVAPNGPMYQAGTLSGNPLSTASGLATLRALDSNAYQYLESLGTRLSLRGVLVQRQGSMLTPFFTSLAAVRNLDEAKASDASMYARFFHEMLAAGFWLPPSPLEAWFVSTAHTPEDIDAVSSAAAVAIDRITK
ncbi:MAG: glutamate-1-semialdehyde 2,1-aminomutase [Actinomycetota bacterium]